MKMRLLVECIKNDGYEASLEVRKVYHLLKDAQAESIGMLRVVDESGDDYLYPSKFFVPVEKPAPFQSRVIR